MEKENKIIYLGVVIFFAILFYCIIQYMGFNFPVPWTDESLFGTQSYAFYKSNTLFTNALSDHRTIMWMQPGYMLLSGVAFKIFGYSFFTLRTISTVFYIMSFCTISYILLRFYRSTFIALAVILFAFPSAIAIGNVGRMESIILFISLLIVLSLLHRKYIAAVSFIFIGVLVHFNILYFGLPIVLVAFYDVYSNKSIKILLAGTTKKDIFLLLIAMILLVCYGVYICNHYDSFIHDMKFQFHRKLSRERFYTHVKTLMIIALLVVMLFTSFYWKKKNVLLAFSLSLSSFILFVNGQEMWYLFFLKYALVWFLVGLGMFLTRARIINILLTLLLTFYCVNCIHKGFAGMRMGLYSRQYISQNTVNKIEQILLQQKHLNHHLSVSFAQSGIPMAFIDFLDKHQIKLIQYIPEKMVKPRVVDVLIDIRRPQDPQWVKHYQYSYDLLKIVSFRRNELVLYNK